MIICFLLTSRQLFFHSSTYLYTSFGLSLSPRVCQNSTSSLPYSTTFRLEFALSCPYSSAICFSIAFMQCSWFMAGTSEPIHSVKDVSAWIINIPLGSNLYSFGFFWYILDIRSLHTMLNGSDWFSEQTMYTLGFTGRHQKF